MDNAVFRLDQGDDARQLHVHPAGDAEVPRRLLHPKKRTVGVRIPRHVVAQALLAELGEPLVSSTLLLPGEDETDDPGLGDQGRHSTTLVDAVLDSGDCGSEPTTVVDFSDGEPEIVRVGAGDPGLFGPDQPRNQPAACRGWAREVEASTVDVECSACAFGVRRRSRSTSDDARATTTKPMVVRRLTKRLGVVAAVVASWAKNCASTTATPIADPTRCAVCSIPPPAPARAGSTSARVSVTFGEITSPPPRPATRNSGASSSPTVAVERAAPAGRSRPAPPRRPAPARHHQRAAEPLDEPPAEPRRDRRPDRERHLGQRRPAARVAQALLQVERQRRGRSR